METVTQNNVQSFLFQIKTFADDWQNELSNHKAMGFFFVQTYQQRLNLSSLQSCNITTGDSFRLPQPTSVTVISNQIKDNIH